MQDDAEAEAAGRTINVKLSWHCRAALAVRIRPLWH